MYKVQTDKFSGPIEKLVELIEQRKLPITELSLAEVTADFLKYLKTIEKIEPRLLADFIVVASRLLLIKSKSLLPEFKLTVEEKEGIKDLEERLRRYRAFKPAIYLFKKTYERNGYSVSRPLFLGRFVSPTGGSPIFYPSKNLSVKILHRAINSVFEAFREFAPEVRVSEFSPMLSLEEKIEEVVNRLQEGIGQFGKIAAGKSRSEIIVLFLALLHLLRDQLVKAEQKEGFSDIIIEKRY